MLKIKDKKFILILRKESFIEIENKKTCYFNNDNTLVKYRNETKSIKNNINNIKRIKAVKINEKAKIQTKYLNYYLDNKIILILLIIFDIIQIISANNFHLIEFQLNKIKLKIKGTGIKNILGNTPEFSFDNNSYPDEIYINDEKQNEITYCYNFNETVNFVELIWFNNITNCRNMFRACSDIIEFDFSEFDTSQVVDMWCMFFFCTSLTSLDVSNFVTSKVITMAGMFQGLTSLTSLNISNFDISNVFEMNTMFGNSSSLTSLDLSNFFTPQATIIYSFFEHCTNLEYINIKNFNERSYELFSLMFTNVPDNVVICANEDNISEKILPQIKEKSCYKIDCSNNWKLVQKKIIYETGECIESCLNSQYQYEYNGKCYQNCAKGYFIDENNIYKCKCELDKCLSCPPVALKNNLCTKCNTDYYQIENDSSNLGEYINCYKNPKGYYLDSIIYKKCYYTCETCEINGNNITHNCITCNENYSFSKSFDNYYNCYENGTYYIDYSSEQINYSYLNYIKLSEYSINVNSDYSDISYLNSISISNKINEYSEYPLSSSIIYEYYEPIYLNSLTDKFSEFNIYSEIITSSYKLINNDSISQILISTSSNSKVIYECKREDSLINNCNFKNINNNTEIFDIIKNNIQYLYNSDNGKGQIIHGTNGQLFQITNGKNELELLKGEFLNNQNLSILDLGSCEIKLKQEYHINDKDSLIYLKQENTNSKASEKNIQYEIYEPYNFTKLNLSICKDETINLYVKAELSGEIKDTYEYMKSLGYDMLNINDQFYQDICIPYKSGNNTDITLSDRIDYIYNNQDSQCQSNCQFSSYLYNSLYINCTCSVEEDKPKEEIQFNSKKLYESFYEILKYSNFKILKCYNLIFRKNVFDNNRGGIITLILFSLHFICFMVFIIRGIVPLKNQVKIIISKTIEKNGNKTNTVLNKKRKENKILKNKQSKKKIYSHPQKRIL